MINKFWNCFICSTKFYNLKRKKRVDNTDFNIIIDFEMWFSFIFIATVTIFSEN